MRIGPGLKPQPTHLWLAARRQRSERRVGSHEPIHPTIYLPLVEGVFCGRGLGPSGAG